MAYKQKSGSPFQRNFGIGKSPLEGQSKSSTPAGKDHDKKHSEGHWEKEENKGTHPKHEKGNKAERLKEAMAKIKASKAKAPLEMASPLPLIDTKITYPATEDTPETTKTKFGTESVKEAQRIAFDTAKAIRRQKDKFLRENPHLVEEGYNSNSTEDIPGFKADLSNQPKIDLSGKEAKEFFTGSNRGVTSSAGDIYKKDNTPAGLVQDQQGNEDYDKITPQSLMDSGTITTDLDHLSGVDASGMPVKIDEYDDE